MTYAEKAERFLKFEFQTVAVLLVIFGGMVVTAEFSRGFPPSGLFFLGMVLSILIMTMAGFFFWPSQKKIQKLAARWVIDKIEKKLDGLIRELIWRLQQNPSTVDQELKDFLRKLSEEWDWPLVVAAIQRHGNAVRIRVHATCGENVPIHFSEMGLDMLQGMQEKSNLELFRFRIE